VCRLTVVCQQQPIAQHQVDKGVNHRLQATPGETPATDASLYGEEVDRVSREPLPCDAILYHLKVMTPQHFERVDKQTENKFSGETGLDGDMTQGAGKYDGKATFLTKKNSLHD